MSVSISQFQTVGIGGAGARLAHYDPQVCEISIWPQGVGVGPSVVMSLADWSRINTEVRLAMMRAEGRL